MEGRLLPPEAGQIQAFPRLRWDEEFARARQVPVSYIEWIFDAYGADVNPLAHDVPKLRSLIERSGVALRSLCADYFMHYPFVRCTYAERCERRTFLVTLLDRARQVGVRRLVIPFVDASSIIAAADVDAAVEVLWEALPAARAAGVELHLETSLGPAEFKTLLDRLRDPMIKVNYDTGNSASLGFRAADEFEAYGERIGSVHIKDRLLGAGSVPLGTGDADFPAIFAGLRALAYDGDFTLQVARSTDGGEVAWARRSRAFVARHWALE